MPAPVTHLVAFEVGAAAVGEALLAAECFGFGGRVQGVVLEAGMLAPRADNAFRFGGVLLIII